MKWYKIKLTKSAIDSGEIQKIINLFRDIISTCSAEYRREGIVILGNKEFNKDYTIYFSPNCLKISSIRNLIDIYIGNITNAPLKGTVNFLCGDSKFSEQFL